MRGSINFAARRASRCTSRYIPSEKFFFVLSLPLASPGFGPPKSETDVTCVHACACVDGGCALASSPTYTYSRVRVSVRLARVCVRIGSRVHICIYIYMRVRARVCALNEGHVRQTVRMTFEKVNRQSTRRFVTHGLFLAGDLSRSHTISSVVGLDDYLILHSNIIVRPVQKKNGEGKREKGEKR